MHHARRLTLLISVVLLAVTLAWTPSAADERDSEQPVLLIIGDSITAKSYYGRAVNGKGWWAHVVEDTGARVIMSAENGSGMLRQGEHCEGTTFGERLARLDLARADYVVIEGGVNDLYYCTGRDTMNWARGRDLRTRIPAFMDQLAAAADAAGLPRDHIYVFTPWGTQKVAQRPRVLKIVRASATRIGAEYVDVPAFPARLTRDGIHPTRKGSRFLYRKLVRGSTLLSTISGPVSGPVS